MKRLLLGLLLLTTASPALAGRHLECRSIGGVHNDMRISAARYVRIYGDNILLTGKSGKKDLERWSLNCDPTETGLFCAGHSRSIVVHIEGDGWKMRESVIDRRTGGEITRVVYNCNHSFLP